MGDLYPRPSFYDVPAFDGDLMGRGPCADEWNSSQIDQDTPAYPMLNQVLPGAKCVFSLSNLTLTIYSLLLQLFTTALTREPFSTIGPIQY